jgi:hypothetical protein
MLRLTLMLFAGVLVLFDSCRQRENLPYLYSISASLESANESIRETNDAVYTAIESKLNDQHAASEAAIWKPKADTLYQLSNELIAYLKTLKGELQNKNDFGAGKDGKTIVEKNWLDSSFDNASHELCITLLHTIENNVLVSTNRLLNYFFSHCNAGFICGFSEKFSAIASLSSSYVKRGDIIEVNSGIGTFSTASKPSITIDSKKISLDGDGVATFIFRANKKPGKHIIPIKFEYIKPDGTTETITIKRHYTIAQ